MIDADRFKRNPDTDFRPVGRLSPDEAREEVEALREAVDYHDRLYYVEGAPVVSDAKYDELFARLQELEEAFPELQSENSPTRRVGAPPLDELAEIEHAAPMLSLDAALEREKVDRFLDTVQKESDGKARFSLEPKYDGVSVEIAYRHGAFEYGATRGDGRRGEDVSANLRTVRSIPLRLSDAAEPPAFLSVRGEVFLPLDEFQNLNRRRVESGDEPFANPRNAAAGILKRLESRTVARIPLDVLFYDVLTIEGMEFDTHEQELKRFREWGLVTDERVRFTSAKQPVHEYHARLAEERDELPFEIDGVVIKADDLPLRRRMGTRDRSPRWAFAWKFEPRREVTTLQDIVVQVGKSGMLTPVALLQPVDVGGVTVSRATLHNEDEVHRKDVRPGDEVRIARAGDVIPEVVERVPHRGRKRGPEFRMPKQCPACGAEIVREGAYHVCPAGLSCPPQLAGRLRHYGSREALDIEGLGEETVRQLVDRGLVHDLADLYYLSRQDVEGLELYAEKSARQLYEAIHATENPPLDRFLFALGIRHVGRRVARLLAEHFGSLQNVREASVEELERVPDVGPEIARSVHDFFDDEDNRRVVDRLLQAGVNVQEVEQATREKTLEGLVFVFTGELDRFTREQARAEVERRGARATSSVSRNTDYVVAGENPGSKLDDARNEEGVSILDEDAFERLLKHGPG